MRLRRLHAKHRLSDNLRPRRKSVRLWRRSYGPNSRPPARPGRADPDDTRDLGDVGLWRTALFAQSVTRDFLSVERDAVCQEVPFKTPTTIIVVQRQGECQHFHFISLTDSGAFSSFCFRHLYHVRIRTWSLMTRFCTFRYKPAEWVELAGGQLSLAWFDLQNACPVQEVTWLLLTDRYNNANLSIPPCLLRMHQQDFNRLFIHDHTEYMSSINISEVEQHSPAVQFYFKVQCMCVIRNWFPLCVFCMAPW